MEAKSKFQFHGSVVTVTSWVCLDGTRCVGIFPKPVCANAEVFYAHSDLEQANIYHRMCGVVRCLGGEPLEN
jgi:hypothetical protein